MKKKVEIATLLNLQTYSAREIAKKVGTSAATVSRIGKKLSAGLPPEDNNRENCGKEYITSERKGRRIVSTVLRNRRSNLRALHSMVEEDGIVISPMTLRDAFMKIT